MNHGAHFLLNGHQWTYHFLSLGQVKQSQKRDVIVLWLTPKSSQWLNSPKFSSFTFFLHIMTFAKIYDDVFNE